jgi:hypothetical protein
MGLKNYTSQVPVSRSISYIEAKLARHGARQVVKFYDEKKRVASVAFIMMADGVEVPYKLPAKVAQCEQILRSEVRRPRADTFERIARQAERTAWKIVSDWVDAQMAMIELSQVEFMEVFLPYLYSFAKEQTFFEAIKERGYKALLPGFVNEDAKKVR